MELLLRLILLLSSLLSGLVISDPCVYRESTSSQYVNCLSKTQKPPYACESNGGGNRDDTYQIHILETDLDRISYNETSPPEIVVVIKPWTGRYSPSNTAQDIVLVLHSFKRVTWRVYSDLFPVGTNFFIKSSYPLIIDPSSVLANTPVEIMSTLPKDSENVIRTVESYFGQRITSFNGFHEGTRINWSVGPGDNDSPCTIQPLSLTKRIQIYKEIPVPTTGCTVPAGQGYNTHIIDIGSTHDSQFPLAKKSATVVVKSKIYSEEFYGSNVVIILKSKNLIEWTIDTSGMDGNVLVVTNGKSRTPDQSNLKVNIVGLNGLPDVEPQEFINYISRTYGVVASYTKTDMANHIIIEVPEVVAHTSTGNTTDTPRTQPLPDMEEIIASVDGQKSVSCYRETVTISWPLMLLDSLYVQDIYFPDDDTMSDRCGLQIIADQGTLLSGYEECGFTGQDGEFSSLYTAKVAVVLNDRRTSQISISCRIYNQTRLNQTPKANLYQLSIYDNADYSNQVSESTVPDNGFVYFKADLKEITDPHMSAIVEECFVSPTADNILDRHVLISQTCPLDSSIDFLNQNFIGVRDEPSQKVKFRMSNYFMYSKDYYLHCKVSMCSKIITPDIPRCSSLFQLCKRNPPTDYRDLQPGYEREYILAGPISLNFSITDAEYETKEPSDVVIIPCKEENPGDPYSNLPGRTSISIGLLIGIALGSFATGIILTVFAIHCVTVTRSRTNKLPPTEMFRFQNRPAAGAENLYEPIKIYDVCPQGHHLNRTSVGGDGRSEHSQSHVPL